MRVFAITCTAAALALPLAMSAASAVKQVSYSEVKVETAEAYAPDAAFETMRKALLEAIARKDAAAVFSMVGPTFVWTVDGGPTEQFDMGRTALDNFKVVFGFRVFGKDSDGGVENGPYWDALAGFLNDATFYRPPDAGNLVCGPKAADVANPEAYERAQQKIGADDTTEWYFTLAPTSVAKSPGDAGAPIAKVDKVALPVLDVYPPSKEGQPPAQPTHLQVLLPSGKTGWIAASAARSLVSDRLCYAKTPSGDWKIAAYDQSE
jgi:hypothetical protein